MALSPQDDCQQGSGWRRSERLILLACVLFAALEILVFFQLERIVEGAMA